MSIFSFFNRNRDRPFATPAYKLITERGNGLFTWDGNLYESDIIRSCIRPFASACGKAVPKHLRGHGDSMKINPEPYIRFLLEEPNPYMSMQQLLEKLARQRELNNNAFALITRDEEGFPTGIYPIDAVQVNALYDKEGFLFLQFLLANGMQYTFSYDDVIHLRQDFGTNDIFGTPPGSALTSVMTVIGATDKSIVSAINNGSVIRWLLKYSIVKRPQDLEAGAKEFAKSFLETGNGTGVAAVGGDADAKQITPTDYVPNAAMNDRTVSRLYSYFGTNLKIIQGLYTEDEWNAYYESKIEPFLIDFSNESTRKIFTRRERGTENRIVCESSNLAYASAATKLKLSSMVDRGALTPNEWRAIMNMTGLEGGDEPIRRLDTAAISETTTETEQTEEGGER